MNRREFFKGIATISLATLLGAAAPLPTPVEFKGKMLKPAQGGRILESTDGGRNWQFNANFGPECSVLQLTPQDNELFATIDFHGLKFYLKSPNGTIWYESATGPRHFFNLPLSNS